MTPGRCRVALNLDGHPRLFLVDTGLEHSYLRGDVKKNVLARNPQAEMAFGPASVAIASLETPDSTLYREVPAVAGVVGLDVLSKVAVGIDYLGGEVIVWPAGKHEADETDWVKTAGTDAKTLDIGTPAGGDAPFVRTGFGDCELDTGATISLVPASASNSPSLMSTKLSSDLELFDGTAGRATQAIASEFQVGGESLFGCPVLIGDKAATGVFAPSALGRKVVIDIPNHRLIYAERTPVDDACVALSSLLKTPVVMMKGRLHMLASRPSESKRDPWAELISVNGRSAEDVLALYQKRDPEACVVLEHAYAKLPTGCKVVIQKDGKPSTILVGSFFASQGG